MKKFDDPYITYYNANPWKVEHENDCAIRAVKAAIGMKYAAVCEAFGRKCVPGRGLDGSLGIPLETIKRRFDKFFDRVEDASEASYENRPEEFDDMEFDPAFDFDPDLGLTLDEFCGLYDGQGRFLISMVANPNAENYACRLLKGGHILYGDFRKQGNPRCYDIWNCGECVVRSFMRVKAVLSRRDPRSVYFGK